MVTLTNQKNGEVNKQNLWNENNSQEVHQVCLYPEICAVRYGLHEGKWLVLISLKMIRDQTYRSILSLLVSNLLAIDLGNFWFQQDGNKS